MDAQPEQNETAESAAPPAAKPKRWRRIAGRLAIGLLVVVLCAAFLVKDHVRTLRSLRQVPGTNAYVMDYYVDYNMDEIRSRGMDVNHVEDSLIEVFFPDVIAAIATEVKGLFIDEKIEALPTGVERCSSVVLHSPNGHVLFGRNLDWKHDAHLILRIRDGEMVKSVSVIDLHYLNLDRDDLESTNLLQRIPLLFAPYYLQDGMNRHGVAVSDMLVEGVQLPRDTAKPDVIHSTAMRLVLDYAKTLDEAIDLLKQYNIHFVETSCHLMIADAVGKSAVVEFIDGEMQVTPAAEHWQVCTNHQIFGKGEVENDECCGRYRGASDQLAKIGSTAGADDLMRVMESVSKDGWTMWTSVYDLTSREFRIAYRRHFDTPYIGSFESTN